MELYIEVWASLIAQLVNTIIYANIEILEKHQHIQAQSPPIKFFDYVIFIDS